MAQNNDTLLYVGAATDVDIPFHRTNILIDTSPESKYYFNCNGDGLEANMLATLQHGFVEMLAPDLEFARDDTNKKWSWIDRRQDLTVKYYHGFDYKKHDLPTDITNATVLYVCGFFPTGLISRLPRLHTVVLGDIVLDPNDHKEFLHLRVVTNSRRVPTAILQRTKKRSKRYEELQDFLMDHYRVVNEQKVLH